jgi:hypothetical protein
MMGDGVSRDAVRPLGLACPSPITPGRGRVGLPRPSPEPSPPAAQGLSASLYVRSSTAGPSSPITGAPVRFAMVGAWAWSNCDPGGRSRPQSRGRGRHEDPSASRAAGAPSVTPPTASADVEGGRPSAREIESTPRGGVSTCPPGEWRRGIHRRRSKDPPPGPGDSRHSPWGRSDRERRLAPAASPPYDRLMVNAVRRGLLGARPRVAALAADAARAQRRTWSRTFSRVCASAARSRGSRCCTKRSCTPAVVHDARGVEVGDTALRSRPMAPPRAGGDPGVNAREPRALRLPRAPQRRAPPPPERRSRPRTRRARGESAPLRAAAAAASASRAHMPSLADRPRRVRFPAGERRSPRHEFNDAPIEPGHGVLA